MRRPPAAAVQHPVASLLGAELLALPGGRDEGGTDNGGLPESECREWRSPTAGVETLALRTTAVLAEGRTLARPGTVKSVGLYVGPRSLAHLLLNARPTELIHDPSVEHVSCPLMSLAAARP